MLNISNDFKKNILNFCDRKILDEALKFSKQNIYLVRKEQESYYIQETYKVFDREDYTCNLYFYRNDNFSSSCTCSEYRSNRMCRHIIFAYIVSFDDFSEISDVEKVNNVISTIFNVDKKEEVRLELIFCFDNYDDKIRLKLKVGIDKLYMVNSKINLLMDALKYNYQSVYFGNNFTFDSEIHKFNETDVKILDFISNTESFNSRYNNLIFLSYIEFEYLLSLIGDKPYTIDGYGKCIGYKKGVCNELNLNKDGEDYSFDFNILDIDFLDSENRYVYKDGLYILDEKIRRIYSELINYDLNNIVLKEKEALQLSKVISNDFKEKFIIEDELKDKFEIVKPKVKMYFDLKKDIVCKLVFNYKNVDYNYFDKHDLKNDIFEESIVSKLKEYGFIVGDKIYISKLNDMVLFLEEYIYLLKDEFEVFTTENLNSCKITTSSVGSNFSIGKDNILSYQFELGEIDESELGKLFDGIKNKEKYFKLKNGNILNTSSNDLIELMDVMENLDVYDSEGFIPKYRALYLDSINYDSVKTDNLFDKFISKFNNNKNGVVNFNKNDLSILRDYQVTGVNWLYNIYKSGFGGILADEMGLGKTIQTIMFIKEVLKNKECKILIISPTSLIYNWENEFLKFGNELKFKVIADNKEKRIKDLNDDYNIYITSYGRLRIDFDEYKDKNFELIIIDEAQNIKNPKAGISKALKGLSSNCKIALTGTPVENSVLEVWSIFDFIMPGFLNSLNNFQSKFNIKDMDEKAHEKLKTLASLINPFILRRKKCDVLKDLPAKIENNIYLDLGDEQKKIYAMQVRKTKQEFDELMASEGFLKARFKILQLLTKLRQICVDPSLVFDYKGSSIKTEEVVKLLNSYIENGHKVLLFSSFKTAIDNLKYKLKENGISYYSIDGSVSSKNRSMLVDNFNKDNTNVFLITLKAGGTGLNLTSADVVIHLDLWWNPQVENQATDRAHRIGQINNVEVVKLICRGTIEEKIVELQEKKKILNDQLIDNENKDEVIISKLSEGDIKNLLSSSQ